MDMSLEGRKAFVSGSTAGIGYAVARQLARMGATVLINGRTQGSVDAALDRLKSEVPGGSFLPAAADLLSDTELNAILTRCPIVDILINNVGVYTQRDFFQLSDDDWLDFFRTNVLIGVRLVRHYLPPMLEANWGRIVNVASEAGVLIRPEMIHYGVSKAAQLAFSRGAAELTTGTGVTVNAVIPGPTFVETVDRQLGVRADQAGLDKQTVMRDTFEVRHTTSLLKRYTTPEEVANLICYLCSAAASATNGAPLRVDGGIVRAYT